jgi:hypothetical protein
MKEGRGSGAVLYFNPLERAAKEAIASGRLRLLAPRRRIRFDRPSIVVHTKWPRFKIPKDE